jgi:thiol-disulfide isomerase/thioredoxin
MMPIVAQDEDTAAVQVEDKPVVQEKEAVVEDESEVAVVPDTDSIPDMNLNTGDIAPTWALMYAPAKFEFLKNWTVERGARLRKFKSQPNRHVVVVSFFATWCKPCMKELPLLQNLYEKYDGQRVKWFLVDITEATRTSPGFEDSPVAGPFLAKKGITMQILNDNRGVAKERYGAKTLPRLFVIDKFQTIRLAKQGFHEGEDFEGEISTIVDELLVEAEE